MDAHTCSAWRLPRNCALGPRQTLLAFAAGSALHLVIGAGFAIVGYPLVLLFVLLCQAALAVAWLGYARHAGDCETVTLRDGRLTVEQQCGAHVTRTELHAAWVRVVPPAGPHGLVALCESNRRVEVGRHTVPHGRADLARELRLALAASRA